MEEVVWGGGERTWPIWALGFLGTDNKDWQLTILYNMELIMANISLK